jgi:drug/metabolite transporter (DMT)-like permease
MGYLFSLISVFACTTKGFCGKKISAYTKEYRSAMLSNSLRMLICIVIGAAFVIFDGGFSAFAVSGKVLLISALSGVMTSLLVISWLFSVRRGAYMMVDVFITLGVTVPIVLSSILFKEEIRLNQILGLLILFSAAFIMCSYNNQIKTKLTLPTVILLTITGLSNGLADFSQKLFIKNAGGALVSSFNFYTYIFSALTLMIVFTLSIDRKAGIGESVEAVKKSYVYIIIMAVALFTTSYFKTLAAKHLSSAELYPLNQGTLLILSAFMSAIFFGEKIKPKCVVGIVLTFIGLFIMNVLKF